MFVAISCFDVIGAIIVWNFLQDRPANLGLNKTNKASLRPD
jgi:sugar phosphate permease